MEDSIAAVSALLGFAIVIGTMLPWAYGYRWSEPGVHYSVGVAAALAGCLLVALSALWFFAVISDDAYFRGAFVAAIASFASVAWF